MPRKHVVDIARAVRDARYDIFFDLRATTEDLWDYINKHADYTLDPETGIDLWVKMPSRVNRYVSFKPNF